MRENRVRKLWADDLPVVNGWLAIANSYSAEVMAHEDFDSLTIDMQHGMVDFQAAIAMFQALSTRDCTPLARVPWNDPALIMKSLDAGAYGIICPMVNNREECERFVGACRYAPVGYRSFGPARGILYGCGDYAAKANDTVITLAMIETAQAMENLDDIMSVDGLDAIYIGPSDLAISLGNPPSPEPVAPNVIEAIGEILAAAERNGVKAGIHCPNGASVRDKFTQGFRFATVTNDVRLMSMAAKAEIATARGKN
jgi:4-hydroxy-2-oxoheptanedioate aldolase